MDTFCKLEFLIVLKDYSLHFNFDAEHLDWWELHELAKRNNEHKYILLACAFVCEL